MEDFEKELKLDFLEEATQLLENTEQAFLQLENDLHNKDLIDEIFRFAHNLKGTSRAVGFGVVAEFTHEVENLILKIKQDEVEINAAVVSVLLECNDFIADMIQVLKDDFDATFDSVDLVAKVKEAVVGEMVDVEEYIPAAVESVPHQEEESDFDDMPSASSFDEDEAAMRHLEDAVQFEENPVIPESKPAQLAPGGVEFEENPVMPESKPAQLAPGGVEFEENPVMPESRPVEPAPAENLPGMNVFQGNENITQLAPAQEAKPKPKAKPNLKDDKKTEKDESIRVSLSRVEKLNNFVGELVILQSVLEQQKYKAITDELALKSISQLNKLSKEIQDISMSLRMVPVKTTLQKMSRIVRDTSKALDKKVNLTLIGEETEIDKTVLELIADPLVHIVRNACDHGLEDTADRPSVGKPEMGQITIEAYHEGNNLVIEVIDDGKGIDPSIIKKKAIDKGILNPSSLISNADVIQYIFHPGFSTKDQVSEVSGRGVGMDVVKTNIEKLNGEVRVETKLGKGSVFKIVLPLTMAIIDGMIIRVGEEKFVVPINQVQESLKPSRDDLHFATGLGDCLNLRGNVLPIRKISKLLKMKSDDKEVHNQIVIIAKSKGGLIAVAVDDIIQQQQVVIKKLGKEISDQKGFMGSSILGDGKPAFIVDIDDLCSNINLSTNSNVGKIAA